MAKKSLKKAKAKDRVIAPMFLMMGSIAGCSAKEAGLYARGLARKFITAPELGWVRVFNDKENSRFVFEIQEGEGNRSILEKVLKHQNENDALTLKLNDDSYVTIEHQRGQIFSLIELVDAERVAFAKNFSEFAGPKRLTPLVKDSTTLFKASVFMSVLSLLVLATSVFSVTIGKTFLAEKFAHAKYEENTLKANKDESNPIYGLMQAKTDLNTKNEALARLEYKNGRWSWEKQ